MQHVCQLIQTRTTHDVPERPWQKVGCDIHALVFDLHDYMKRVNLCIVDYYSAYVETDHLERKTAKVVIP